MKQIFKNTIAVLYPKEKKRFGVLIVLDVFINIVDIAALALLLYIIQFYFQPGNNKLSFLPGWLMDKNSIALIGSFVLLFAIKNGAAFLIAKAQFAFISNIAIRISAGNLKKYQETSYHEFVHTDSSVHIRNIGFQPFDFTQYMLLGIQQVVTQATLSLVAIVAIIFFNAKLFLLLLVILLPPAVIVFYFIKKKLTLAKKEIQQSNERSFQYLLDALKGYIESNMYNRNEFFLQRFIKARKKFSTALFNSLALQTLPNRIIEIFAVLGLFILIIIIRQTGNEQTALINIGAFMAAAYKIIPGIVKVINISGQMKAYEFSIEELAKREMKNEGLVLDETAPVINSIVLENIHFQYGERPVLTDFSLHIDTNDFIGITGVSGRGKTTLLNLLLGFLPSASGEILINGQAVDQQAIKRYWPCIAYVRQQHFFIHDTLLRNITMEEEGYNKENLEYAIRISGIEKIVTQFPEGLQKIITENGKNISGGQQQRIAIARALYKNAPVIVLDEPFNELDEEATNLLLTHFRILAAEGKIVLMITHDKKSLAYCNKIIALDEQ